MGYPDEEKFETYRKQLQEKGKIIWKEGYVWIVGKAKKVNGEKQVSAACKCLSEIPDSLELKRMFMAKYNTLSIGYPTLALPIPIPTSIPKPKKESVSPSADSNSTTVEKDNTKQPNWKEIQNRQIEKTQRLWKEIFDQDIKPGECQLLAHGSKKQRVHGFKS